MSFEVPAEAYGEFMGRWSEPLAQQLVDLVDPHPGDRALDVGCGPGALTAVLVERLGADAVSAVDPSTSFVEALAERLPGVDLRAASAEELPFDDDGFDVVTASLVVLFMTDPVAGLREMARVARPGGTVAAAVWDTAGRTGPLTLFWDAAVSLDAQAPHLEPAAGAGDGDLVEMMTQAGLVGVEQTVITVRRRFDDAEQWWHPLTLGVGPAGAYVATLDDAHRDRLHARCLERLPAAPFELSANAWAATGRVPGRE